jgi:hypothetical protein
MHWVIEIGSLTLITLVLQCVFQHTEQNLSTRDIKHHGAELTQKNLPFVDRSAALIRGDQIQDLKETKDTVRRRLDGHGNRVDHPSQDDIASGPHCAPLQHMLDGCWLMSVATIKIVQRAQQSIEGFQQHAFVMTQVLDVALDRSDKIVNIHIPIIDWSWLTMKVMPTQILNWQ